MNSTENTMKSCLLNGSELVAKNRIKIGSDGFAEWPTGGKIPVNYGRGGIAKVGQEAETK
jgi:hypothetical protein